MREWVIMRLFTVATEIIESDLEPGVEKGVIDMATTSEEEVKVVEGDFLAMQVFTDEEDIKEMVVILTIVIKTIVVMEDSNLTEHRVVKETGVTTEMEEISPENRSILLIKMGSDSCVPPVVPTDICYRIAKTHGRT